MRGAGAVRVEEGAAGGMGEGGEGGGLIKPKCIWNW